MNWMSLIDDTMRQTPGWRFIHIEPLGRGPWVMIRAKIQEPSGRLVNIPEVEEYQNAHEWMPGLQTIFKKLIKKCNACLIFVLKFPSSRVVRGWKNQLWMQAHTAGASIRWGSRSMFSREEHQLANLKIKLYLHGREG